ncbi:STAS domain-containing protein [Geovibrio thiophilus]|uniref:STAS domain-containing protein n=1 Tax=Geovibrio thiophilus TaxID=139438 RepID=A0A410K1Q8_9BACT|nr:HEAT repeat domain-containing protein [Geovibrio thiophilus]QAR34339.1 STAS domain-containing protein [Geovibrio thiophilus]
MSVELTRNKDTLRVVIGAESHVEGLNEGLAAVRNEAGIYKVILDLKNCFFLQSKSLATILAFKKEVQKNKAELLLVNVSEEVHQLFEMTNLLPLFNISQDYTSFSADELLAKFLDPEEADRVSDYIAENYTDEIKARLYDVLEGSDPLLKEYAVLTIGKAHDYDAAAKIKECLDSDSGSVVRAAILVIGWFGELSVKERLYEFLKSTVSDVAEAAAGSIALLADDTDAEKIGMLLKSDSPRLRIVASQALSLINDSQSYTILLEHLKAEKNEDVRAFTVKSLAGFNKPGVADILLAGFDDESLKVREASAGGLVRIKAKDKIEEILKRITDKDSWVGYFAVKALGEMHSEISAEKLIEAYAEVEENVRLAIIEALGKIKYDSSVFLQGLIKDDNEDVRKEVLGSLMKIKPDAAAQTAAKLVVSDESWLVRFKAVEILDTIRPTGYKDVLRSRLTAEENKYVREKIQNILEVL